MSSKKIYIIAGEASGDAIGAKLIRSLKKKNKDIQIFGIGGTRMQAEGFQSLFPMSELSLMGFVEILPHLPNLISRINQTVDDIRKTNPDAVITIDSPGFCFKVVEKIQNEAMKLIHYVAPTVWAYKPERAAKVARLYDHQLLILPFEPPYFDAAGIANSFVGHPICEDFEQIPDREIFRKKYNIASDEKLLCIMPGSRITEINRLMPVFIGAISRIIVKMPDIKIVIPTLKHLRSQIEKSTEKFKNIIITDDINEKMEAFAASDAALVKSGSGALELAFAKVPMVVGYKINPISYWLIKRLVKVKFANIVNLILDREVIPELIQDNFTADKAAEKTLELLQNADQRINMINSYDEAIARLGANNKNKPSDKAASIILGLID